MLFVFGRHARGKPASGGSQGAATVFLMDPEALQLASILTGHPLPDPGWTFRGGLQNELADRIPRATAAAARKPTLLGKRYP